MCLTSGSRPNFHPSVRYAPRSCELQLQLSFASSTSKAAAQHWERSVWKDALSSDNGASASFYCLSRSLGPIVTGIVLGVGIERGYAGMAFSILWMTAALLGALVSVALEERP